MFKAVITDRDYNKVAEQTAKTVRDAISRANREAETSKEEFVRVTVSEKQADGQFKHVYDVGHWGQAEAVSLAQSLRKARGLR